MPKAKKIEGEVKIIKVSESTLEELKLMKKGRENYDSVIRRLIRLSREVQSY
jgi:predicted CopG family antitoxin